MNRREALRLKPGDCISFTSPTWRKLDGARRVAGHGMVIDVTDGGGISVLTMPHHTLHRLPYHHAIAVVARRAAAETIIRADDGDFGRALAVLTAEAKQAPPLSPAGREALRVQQGIPLDVWQSADRFRRALNLQGLT